ncbi:MAG: methanogenesis marker 5 protein [Methanosarcinaceae archaeon]
MTKVFIYPTNSLILSDLIERSGHTPLAMMGGVHDKITTIGIDSPPLNITPEDPKHGLKYAAVEVPAGVRGRMSIVGPLIDEAEAAIIVDDAAISFGCMGCARTNELTKFLTRDKGIPVLELIYPKSDEEGREFVYMIREFLESLSKEAML